MTFNVLVYSTVLSTTLHAEVHAFVRASRANSLNLSV